jgi:polysaccharide pyruvyl transferase WcaK-like protein
MTKILHIASFSGNIGDNANHNGLRHQLEKFLKNDGISYTELEIRKFYQNYSRPDKLRFDDAFAQLANEHDLVIIGGGNFFEIWIESSQTGTTIDISPSTIDKIDTPMFFFGLGFDPYKGIPEGNIEKFKRFIDKLAEKKRHTITVRNDGSSKHIEKYLGKEYLKKIKKIPDGGFFLQIENPSPETFNIKSRFVAINVAKDMADLRFQKMGDGITYETFVSRFAKTLDAFLTTHTDMEIVFVPHIYSDIDAIFDVLDRMEDIHRRNRISVAPLLHGKGSEQIVFDIYRKAEFSMGMRFHTNVCSIGLNTPTIGLISYPKLKDLYEEVGMPDRTVTVNRKNFEKRLIEKMEATLLSKQDLEKRYSVVKKDLEKEIESLLSEIF